MFVFAGGTSETFQQFQDECSPTIAKTKAANKKPDKAANKAPDKAANKARDFLSRLQGHVDVLGLSPRPNDPNDHSTSSDGHSSYEACSRRRPRASSLATYSEFAGDPREILDCRLRLRCAVDRSDTRYEPKSWARPHLGLADLPPEEQIDMHSRGWSGQREVRQRIWLFLWRRRPLRR